ncbi:MAG: response regulator [Planctomycetes bacterium]|nr:response regulator [Planctomycetota bacterium]
MTDECTKPVDILIADDNHDFSFIASKFFTLEGYNTVTAKNGTEALKMVREFKPRLVILDSMLPSKPGFECLCEIKADEELKNTQVVMCSGKGDLGYVLSCGEAGAEGFFHKPLEMEDLVARVGKLMRA